MARRRILPGVLVAVAVVLVVGIAAVWLLGPRSRRPVPTELQPTPSGSINILLVGKDARALGPVTNEGRQRNRREGQSRSDIVIVCHINFSVPSMNLVAVPRDLLVEVPGITRAASPTDFRNMEKIAHAYAIGGDKLLRRALEHLLGIPIHRSIAFDFDSFRMAFDVLRPFVGVLRVGDVVLTERDQALKFARKRYGLKFDDADRSRNALSFIRAVVGKTWWLGNTRLGDALVDRVLAIVGADTDLTRAEIDQVVADLRRAGFQPGTMRTALLVGEGADVTLNRYNLTLSCYLPVYREIEKQVDHYLLDKQEVEALDFMTLQSYSAPGYVFGNYVVPADTLDTIPPLPFDTTGLDTQVISTRLKELGRQHERPETASSKPQAPTKP
jgi:hypothetical protein